MCYSNVSECNVMLILQTAVFCAILCNSFSSALYLLLLLIFFFFLFFSLSDSMQSSCFATIFRITAACFEQQHQRHSMYFPIYALCFLFHLSLPMISFLFFHLFFQRTSQSIFVLFCFFIAFVVAMASCSSSLFCIFV